MLQSLSKQKIENYSLYRLAFGFALLTLFLSILTLNEVYFSPKQTSLGFFLIAGSFFFTFFFLTLERVHLSRVLIQIVVDSTMIFLWIFNQNSVEPFTFVLYFVQTAILSLLFLKKVGLFVAGVHSICICLLLYIHGPGSLMAVTYGFLFTIANLFLGFCGGYLTEEILKTNHELKQNEKLAGIGQLAAGIAHEIRNPLAGISGSLQLLKSLSEGNSRSSEEKKLMEICLKEIDRLNDLITEFLDYVKPTPLDKVALRLGPLLDEVLLAFRQAHPSDRVRVETKFDTDLQVKGHASKLKQVLWNLLTNSVQAIDSKKEQLVVTISVASSGHHFVLLSVSDNGVGMSTEVMNRLFEPFFTTKEKGSGLGLAVTRKIIESLGGTIAVSSTLGEGTKFEIKLERAS